MTLRRLAVLHLAGALLALGWSFSAHAQALGAAPYEFSPAALRLPLNNTGALIPEDPGAISHVYWQGGVIHDTHGLAWSMTGTVPQTTASPFGSASGLMHGAGPFSGSNWYSVPTNITGSGTFSGFVRFNVVPDGVNVSRLITTAGAGLGFSVYVTATGALTFYTPCGQIATGAISGVNTAAFGWTGTTLWLAANGGAPVTGTCSISPGSQTGIGSSSADHGASSPLAIYELYLTSQAPSAALFTSWTNAAWGLNDQIKGGAVTLGRSSTATCENSSGAWIVPANLPCIGPEPVSGMWGLRGETQRTNVALYSGNILPANSYTFSNVVVTGGPIPAPDYNATLAAHGTLITNTNGASGAYVASTSTVATNTYTCGSIYAQGNTATTMAVDLTGSPAKHCEVISGPATGGSGTAVVASNTVAAGTPCVVTGLTPASDRIAVCSQAATTAATSMLVYPETAGAGTGKSIGVWGYQLEAADSNWSWPTSYIPTTTAAVTRAGDANQQLLTDQMPGWTVHDQSFGADVVAPYGACFVGWYQPATWSQTLGDYASNLTTIVAPNSGAMSCSGSAYIYAVDHAGNYVTPPTQTLNALTPTRWSGAIRNGTILDSCAGGIGAAPTCTTTNAAPNGLWYPGTNPGIYLNPYGASYGASWVANVTWCRGANARACR